MDGLIIIMLASGGLFTSGALLIVWKRLSFWKTLTLLEFRDDFGKVIRVADTVQPILLSIAILSGAVFAFHEQGYSQIWAYLAITGYCSIMIISLIILVPLQRRILSINKNNHPAVTQRMRQIWSKGHTGRTLLAVVAFTLSLLAAAFE